MIGDEVSRSAERREAAPRAAGIGRSAVGFLAVAAAGHAVWLLVVGVRVQVASIGGVTQFRSEPLWSAVIPLMLSFQVIYGVVRNQLAVAWFGVVASLTFGVLFLFGAGPYFLLLGAGMLIAMTGWSVTARSVTG